jgi:hypothetical protein
MDSLAGAIDSVGSCFGVDKLSDNAVDNGSDKFARYEIVDTTVVVWSRATVVEEMGVVELGRVRSD